MKKISLHSLVILVGPAGSGKSYLADKKFEPYEVLSADEIRETFTGEIQRMDLNDLVFKEIHRRAIQKLEMGERVVIDAVNLRRKDRSSLYEIGLRFGVPIYYLVCPMVLKTRLSYADQSWRANFVSLTTKQDQIFRTNERDIMRGDGVATVIMSTDEFEVVKKLPKSDIIANIKARGFRGLMVIGDVHGMLDPLKNATEWATRRGLFCVFLGDVVDYGPNSLECVDHVYDIVVRGRGLTLIGNHERKIARWLDQVKSNDVRLRLSEGNKVTTRAIEHLGFESRRRFEIKFKTLMEFSRHHWVVGDTMFTHGAAEPEMFDISSSRLMGKFENLALFGEVDSTAPARTDGYPNRVYDWVNRIPEGKRVMVGHDIRSTTKPLHVKGDLGGEAYFMDTGSGKGGRLTSADLLFENNNLVIKAFKYH